MFKLTFMSKLQPACRYDANGITGSNSIKTDTKDAE